MQEVEPSVQTVAIIIFMGILFKACRLLEEDSSPKYIKGDAEDQDKCEPIYTNTYSDAPRIYICIIPKNKVQ